MKMKSSRWHFFPAGALVSLAICTAALAAGDPWLRPSTVPAPQDNRNNAARIDLGKTLFFDPRLSRSNWISCASCHNPSFGWSDGLRTGFGHNMAVLGRHTPTILNTAYNPSLMWDGRKATLEEQALGPIEGAAEMDQDLGELVKKLDAIPGYRVLFETAYPGEGVTLSTIAKAIASFERTIVSGESAFTRWRKGDATALAPAAKRGFALFTGKANCVACHMGWNFTDNGFHNIGLRGDDVGRFAQRKAAVLRGAFKTPTLHDIALSAPYMHNGLYGTLEEVVDHYDRGGDVSEHRSPNVKPLGLGEREKADLVAFLKSLTSPPPGITLPRLPH